MRDAGGGYEPLHGLRFELADEIGVGLWVAPEAAAAAVAGFQGSPVSHFVDAGANRFTQAGSRFASSSAAKTLSAMESSRFSTQMSNALLIPERFVCG